MLRFILFGVLSVSATAAPAERINFNRDIRPILSDRCFQCHGPNEKDRKGHLRLDQAEGEEGAYRRQGGTRALTPKSLEESELWYRITTDDPADAMPPADDRQKPLTALDKQRFKQWIIEGAEYQAFWAFVPPEPSPPPWVRNAAWKEGIIDPYVMARLEKKRLRPKGEADRRTLIRRLTFDLTGLPPLLSEIDAFLKDESSGAYAALVERLLSRKTYGEHMARYWADLVRLADTNGMHKDFPRDFSTYRTWLIRAFNDNLRFDEFIKYQVAGDLYPEASRDQLIASGFNRLHLIIDRGTALPEESHHKNVLDRMEAFGTTFLGLTLQCAQCHDHKYDPISQQEYYQLYGFFNNFDGEPETGRLDKGALQAPFIRLTSPEQDTVLEGLNTDEEALVSDIAKLKGNESDEAVSSQLLALDKALTALKKRRENLLAQIPAAMVMKDRDEPRPTHLLMRGAYDAPGELVERNTPAFLPPLEKKEGIYTRMDLAQWLVAKTHPLTARVAVNRFWQQFFGVGLVKTSEDFGARGEWPSHPKLLDDLSIRFMESAWDVKTLVRAIVRSKTYRQASDGMPAEFRRDPENRDLARGSRYRMDAEMIRDQILFLSGRLNTKMYGKSVKPPQPPGLWKAVSMAAPLTYVPDEGDKIYRRSFYTYWRRGMPPPQMTIMNAPSREFCLARRERTNTPLQALLLMNEPEFFKAARACAERTRKEAKGNTRRGLSLLYEKITSHRPHPERLRLLIETLAAFRELYRADRALTEALLPELTEADFDRGADLAAWTMVTHGLFNLELAKVRR